MARDYGTRGRRTAYSVPVSLEVRMSLGLIAFWLLQAPAAAPSAPPPDPWAAVRFMEGEALENVRSSWEARETYEVVSPDEFVETFELAMGDKPYQVYSKARF